MTRVWLSGWEWECCGEPFVTGDGIDLGIETRSASSNLSEMIGPDLAATIDAVESHHEQEFTDRVRGRVASVHAVSVEMIERRSLRRPGHGAPQDAVMPPEGEDWPRIGLELGDDVFIGTQPSRYMLETTNVPDTAVLEPVDGVRFSTAERAENPVPLATIHAVDPPPERRARSRVGWLVEVDENAPGRPAVE